MPGQPMEMDDGSLLTIMVVVEEKDLGVLI